MCRVWRKPRHVSPFWLRPKSCGVNRCTWMSEQRPSISETCRARWEQMHDGSTGLWVSGWSVASNIGMHNDHQFHLLMQDELENYPFKSIYRCDAINTEKHFSSLLLLVCQSADQKKPDIQFFNCETVKVSNNTRAASQSACLTQCVWISLVQVLQVMPLSCSYSHRQSKSVMTSHAGFRVPPPAGVRISLMP